METKEPCEFLPWDSNFFGRRIARVVEQRLDQQRLEIVLAWCERHAIECLYFLADSGHAETVRLAEDFRFRLVDVRVTLHCCLRDWRAADESDDAREVRVRPSCVDDIPALQAIARVSYEDSRFYFDSAFPVESCEALYETWITRSCQGYADATLVAEVEGEPVGYISCHLPRHAPHGQIGLLGTGPQARGRGVGQTLTQHSLRWFAQQRVDVVSVVTQGRNVAAQSLYQRSGFLTHSVQLWYHRWRPDSAPAGD